jgi:hypothetical protein
MIPLLKDPERQKMYEHIVTMFIFTWVLLIILFVVVSVSPRVVLEDSSNETFDAGWKVAEPNEPNKLDYFSTWPKYGEKVYRKESPEPNEPEEDN